ncbi:MAG: hypothetical protein F4057_02965, partial [Acidobacteria bacterium]|nr:hypothetical protein [Acidobacteriota bacterium]
MPQMSAPARYILPLILVSGLCGVAPADAEDWPQWRGAGRLGVWHEDGILETVPQAGRKVGWRGPVHQGVARPGVAGGRV